MTIVGMLSHSSILVLDWTVLINADLIYNIHIQLEIHHGKDSWSCHDLFHVLSLRLSQMFLALSQSLDSLGQGLNICSI